MNNQQYNYQIENANMLVSHKKYIQAENILSDLLSHEPTDFTALCLMVMVKININKNKEAEEICSILIAEHPDQSLSYYYMAIVKAADRKFGECHQLLDSAIRLDPGNPNYHAYKAIVYNAQQMFTSALEYAENALSLDAEDADALNARATALVGLNRKDEAFETIDRALESDPNNADTHANLGWTLLHKGQSDRALDHFKISLSIDPNDAYAQAGMLEAMKAKFPVYRYFLMAMLYIGNLTEKYKWGFIVGGYVLYRFLLKTAENNPAIRSYIMPVIVVLGLFFLSSWIFSPLMNLYLLTNKYGKFTLSDHKKLSAKLVGIALVFAMLFFILYLLKIDNDGIPYAALISFIFMIPFGSMLNPITENGRKKLTYFGIAFVVVGVIDILWSLFSNNFGSGLSAITVLLFLGYQFYANYVIIRE